MYTLQICIVDIIVGNFVKANALTFGSIHASIWLTVKVKKTFLNTVGMTGFDREDSLCSSCDTVVVLARRYKS